MKRITNITDEAIQRHIVVFEESEIILRLRFFPKTQHWTFDAEYNGKAVYGVKLSVGVLHMTSENQPFDFFVTDRSGNGIDPFQIDDFANDRCRLYMLETAEMVAVRGGAEVPLP